MKANPSMIPAGVPPTQIKKFEKKYDNIKKATKERETVRKGCQIKSAVNYDKDAILEDNSLCEYTIFYGSY